MKRNFALIASTALMLSAAPLLAGDYGEMKFDPANTLAGDTDQVSTIAAIEGGNIVTSDGILLGQIEDFNISEDSRVAIRVDLEADLRIDGSHMDLTIDPENVTVVDGGVALNATEEDVYTAREPSTVGDIEVRL
ncbi:MAG: hypothetical protein AB3N09_02435 [Tateyamaria sp.]